MVHNEKPHCNNKLRNKPYYLLSRLYKDIKLGTSDFIGFSIDKPEGYLAMGNVVNNPIS